MTTTMRWRVLLANGVNATMSFQIEGETNEEITEAKEVLQQMLKDEEGNAFIHADDKDGNLIY